MNGLHENWGGGVLTKSQKQPMDIFFSLRKFEFFPQRPSSLNQVLKTLCALRKPLKKDDLKVCTHQIKIRNKIKIQDQDKGQRTGVSDLQDTVYFGPPALHPSIDGPCAHGSETGHMPRRQSLAKSFPTPPETTAGDSAETTARVRPGIGILA